MKTLDEVIKAHEFCLASPIYYDCKDCPYEVEHKECGRTDMMQDALYYLKEHKNQQDFYSDGIKRTTEMIDKCEKTVAEYLAVNNPPLTWSELRQMVGKPVWVEWKNDKEWMINLGTIYVLDGSLRMSLRSLRGWHFFTEQEMKDGTWQAYRKEREE